MKTGKNRPLDEDELEFLDGVAAAENAKRKREAEEEAAELDAFHQALKEQQEMKAKAEAEAAEAAKNRETTTSRVVGGGGGGGNSGAKVGTAAAVLRKPKFTAIVKPKRNLDTSKDGGVTLGKGEEKEQPKKQKVEDSKDGKEDDDDDEQGGLAGLLGDYGSDSD
jgi:hypothetical protein